MAVKVNVYCDVAVKTRVYCTLYGEANTTFSYREAKENDRTCNKKA